MKNKVGSIFLVSMLALAGLGMSYAGFFDEITVFGTVNTGTVEWYVEGYSGTWVWKDYIGGVWTAVRTNDPNYQKVHEDAFIVAYAKAELGTDPYDVKMTWNNLFPCFDFTANVIIKYDGSVPAHVTIEQMEWDPNKDDLSQYMTFKYFYWDDDPAVLDWVLFPENEPVQVHFCDLIKIEVIIHILQDNTLQDMDGSFDFTIQALQWYDECD